MKLIISMAAKAIFVLALCRLVAANNVMIVGSADVHPSAEIGPGSMFSGSCKVGPHAQIGSNVMCTGSVSIEANACVPSRSMLSGSKVVSDKGEKLTDGKCIKRTDSMPNVSSQTTTQSSGRSNQYQPPTQPMQRAQTFTQSSGRPNHQPPTPPMQRAQTFTQSSGRPNHLHQHAGNKSPPNSHYKPPTRPMPHNNNDANYVNNSNKVDDSYENTQRNSDSRYGSTSHVYDGVQNNFGHIQAQGGRHVVNNHNQNNSYKNNNKVVDSHVFTKTNSDTYTVTKNGVTTTYPKTADKNFVTNYGKIVGENLTLG